MILAKWHCLSCKHWVGWNKCVAFPKGIPQDITYQESNHTTPRDGDSGLVYEPMEEEKAVGTFGTKTLFSEDRDVEDLDLMNERTPMTINREMVDSHGFDEIYGKPTLIMDDDESPSAKELQIMAVEISLDTDIDDSELAPMTDHYKEVWGKIEFEINEGKARGLAVGFESMEL